MATEPISQLPKTTILSGSESVVLNQTGVTKTAPASAIANLAKTSLATNNDVLITAPAAGQILIYNGTQWINAPISVVTGGGPIATPLTDYIFHQTVPASVWTITHNLNRFPSVTVTDASNDTVIGDVDYVSLNELTISFSGLTIGSAYLV